MEDEAKVKKIRNLTVALLMVFLFTGGCGKPETPKVKEAKTPDASEQAAGQASGDPVNHKVLSFNLEGLNEKGAKKWDVKGESAEAISENEVKLDNIIASAYGEEAEAVITADKGVYDRAKNNVRLEQNVHATIESTQGFTGSFIDGADKKPDAAGASDGGKQKKSKTIITCDGEVQFEYEKNQAYFLKNVKVVNEDGVIDADKITVYFDPATRRLKNIVADGNVKITRGDNTSYSQQARYSEDDKKVTLSGKPKLVLSPEGGMGFDADFLGGAKN
ncbi:MAG: LPS export ABC transporter periplasmic protein LptC [Candidatus Omnitrophica bacterium]|nr:LPS export ABC transporter periplasmic protein LptC [Candidatus Omnitrophota bacterium]